MFKYLREHQRGKIPTKTEINKRLHAIFNQLIPQVRENIKGRQKKIHYLQKNMHKNCS